MTFYQGNRRTFLYASSGVFLPTVGPFANQAPKNASTLPNFVAGFGTTAPDSSANSPLTYNQFTVANTRSLFVNPVGTHFCIFIWCNVLNIGGFISCTAAGGGDGGIQSAAQGGDGGGGASGGGGGNGSNEILNAGNGGSLSAGGAGQPGTGIAGVGGTGSALYTNASYVFPNGGAGTAGQTTFHDGAGGAAGPGYGGGGGGAGPDNGGAGGGGGGGPGLICIVANQIITTNINAEIDAAGGDAGFPEIGASEIAGDGGGGVIVLMTRKYTAAIGTNVKGGQNTGISNPGVAQIYQINSNNSLTLKNFITSF